MRLLLFLTMDIRSTNDQTHDNNCTYLLYLFPQQSYVIVCQADHAID